MRRNRRRWLIPLAALILLPISVTGCGDGEDGRTVSTRSIRELPEVDSGADSLMRRLGYRPTNPNPEEPAAAAAPPSLDYDLPEGWNELAPTRLRQINLKIGSAPATEVYVTILPGSGGGIIANLDRWRGQMGLAPYADDERRKLTVSEVAGRTGLRVDYEGTFSGMGGPKREGYRLLGAIFDVNGYGIFIKMVGPQAEVGAEEARFEAFTNSLVPKGTDPHAGHAHAQAGSFDPRKLEWTAPKGWVKGADRSMRSVTYHPAGNNAAECSVIVLPGTAGGLVANVNRWLGQVGKPPITPKQVEELPKVMILGQASPVVEATGSFRGMSGQEQDDAALIGAICQLDSFSVYVKLTGPRALVGNERDNFLDFCRSLR